MIVEQEFESLVNTFETRRIASETFFSNTEIDLRELTNKSKRICDNWRDYYVDNSTDINFKLTDDMKFIYRTVDNEIRTADITEFAFGQLCTRLGVPASYVKKCFDSGKVNLAVTNFRAWADDFDKILFIREQDGIARAVLTNNYKSFDSHKVIKSIQNTVDNVKYKATGAYLSPDRLHVRFIDRAPLDIKGEKSPLYNGFTVSSSDIGRGSLNMYYFLYRLVCDNGMTVTEKGGTLFRQAHVGSAMTEGKLELFNRAFMDIDYLNGSVIESIRKNREVHLSEYEMKLYLEKAKHALKMSDKVQEKLISIVAQKYDNSVWGLLNGITEVAQLHTLDTRIDYETFAGNTMITRVA